MPWSPGSGLLAFLRPDGPCHDVDGWCCLEPCQQAWRISDLGHAMGCGRATLTPEMRLASVASVVWLYGGPTRADERPRSVER